MILTKEKVQSVNLDNLLLEKINKNAFDEFLLIVPTNRKIRNQKKEFVSASPIKSTSKINLETIGTISGKLLAVREKYIPLSDSASTVLLRQSFGEVNLNYFSGYKYGIPSGTLERIKNVISEYKKNGITPEILTKEAQSLAGSEKIKALDIAAIYKNYQSRCSMLKVKETGDIYSELNKMKTREFLSLFRLLYPSVNLIIINGFDEFTEPEVEIINLLSTIPNAKTYLNFDYYTYNSLIFSHLEKCYGKLIRRQFQLVPDNSLEQRVIFQNIVREKLFQRRESDSKLNFKNQICLIEAAKREKEIELIAKEIKDLLTAKKTEPHKICLSFNLIDKYSPIIRDLFTNYGIPFNLTDRISLSNSYPVNTIINFLEILENDFFYKNIFRALSTDLLDLGNIELAGLIKASVQLKIVSGYNNWVSTIQDAIVNIQKGNSGEDYNTSKNLALYKKALNDIENLNTWLQPFHKKMTLQEFLNNLIELINKTRLPVKLINPEFLHGEINGREEEQVKGLTVFLETVNEIFNLFELEYGKDKTFSLGFFLEHIRTAAASSRFNVKEKSNYGVLITTVNEIRGLHFDYLFISGLCDGDFPTRYNPEIFFSGSYMKNEIIHQTEERYHFYQSLCSWNKGLYLTYPAQEGETELTASNFLKDFQNLFEISKKNEKDYVDLYSLNELLEFAGREGIESTINKYPEIKDITNWEDLSSAIQIDKQRIASPFADSIFTGSLLAGSTNFNLTQQAIEFLDKMGNSEFSVSRLEKYALCPYQYFLEKILRLDLEAEPTEEIEAFELGTLLHNILYEFYTEIVNKKITLSGCNEDKFKQAEDLIFRIAEEKISEFPALAGSALSFFEKEKILGINGNRKNSILYKFLETERINRTDFLPHYFEILFDNLKMESDSGIELMKLKGKIDRIELNEDEKTFKVVDYKLGGKKPKIDELKSGLSLQLPLYMFAAANLLKTQLNEEYNPAEALIYSLKYQEEKFGRFPLLGKSKNYENANDSDRFDIVEKNKELIKTCLDAITKYIYSIKKGKFNLSTLADRENKVCRYCNFRAVCRIQETE